MKIKNKNLSRFFMGRNYSQNQLISRLPNFKLELIAIRIKILKEMRTTLTNNMCQKLNKKKQLKKLMN
jgi:hypothetical protein